ncbi:hypothetical protein QEN19_001961 [Hanseniaspora menglaensis]
MSRSRSNSNSVNMQISLNGSSSSPTTVNSSNINSKPILKTFESTSSDEQISVRKPKLSYVLTLTPLNNTFVKKTLILAPFPQTIKLGRPLTTNSNGNSHQVVASSRNGFFESRILSRTHAQLQLTETNDILLTDLNSSNGTYLNNVKLQQMKPYKILQGDVITLGADIIPNSANGNQPANDNVVHKRIVALVEDITPIVDIGYNGTDNFNKIMLQSSLFGDLIGDIDYHDLLLHGNSFLLDKEEGSVEEEGITDIYKFLKKEIRLSNERNHKLERINLFMKNFAQDIGRLEAKQAHHLDQVKKNYYELINDSLSKKYELIQEKNLKIMKDKNSTLENNLNNFRKDTDIKALMSEQEINKMRNIIEDLETKLQVAKVKLPNIDQFNSANEKTEIKSSEQIIEQSTGEKLSDKKSLEKITTDGSSDSTAKNYKIAYVSSICVVGLFSAFMAYSQNK